MVLILRSIRQVEVMLKFFKTGEMMSDKEALYDEDVLDRKDSISIFSLFLIQNILKNWFSNFLHLFPRILISV